MKSARFRIGRTIVGLTLFLAGTSASASSIIFTNKADEARLAGPTVSRELGARETPGVLGFGTTFFRGTDQAAPMPESTSLVLLSCGLWGLAMVFRRRQTA
jgi:hypothetical protein